LGGFDRVLWTILGIAAVIGGALWHWSSSLAPAISDPTSQGWVGFVGLYLTLLGLALAGHQLWKVRSAAEAVKVSSASLIRQITSSTRLFESMEVKREIALLKSNVIRKELEAALQTLDTVRARFAFLKEVAAEDAAIAASIEAQMVGLDRIENTLRTAQSQNAPLRDPVKLVGEIGRIEGVAMSHAAKFALTSRTESHVKNA
jgi:hypothetical protein